MRLLHTSDWHIGRTFHQHPTTEALRGVLAALAAAVERERVDVVLVAGDVFDSATPAAAAFQVFEEAVLAIRAAGAAVVMTSGNHDSPARLGHQAPFAAAGGVHVRTHADALADPVELTDEHGIVDVFGIPYLEPLLVGGRTHAEVLGTAMDSIRAAVAERGNRSVVLAHCFASAGVQPQAAGGERDITTGGVDVVAASVFEGVDYAALGHLHSRIRLAEGIRYSGAPLHYSFGETSPLRGGWLVDLDETGLRSVTWLDLPVPRALTTITGPLAGLLEDPAHDAVREDWIQAVLTDPVRQQDAMPRLRQRFPFIARLEHRPEGAPPADARSYGERTAGLPDAALIAGFLEHVRAGAGPSDAESALVADVLNAVRAAERAGVRVLRLGIEGFGPFASRQEIDFEALDEAGLFLITGRTGSGKSSILDAICFALYGSAPRYDGGQARLRSDHADPGTPTSVSLELAVGTDRWRVVRSPEYERPKRRGDGFTREPQSATLERWEAGGWVGVAARPVDVAEHLQPILRLTREQFLQVILLAQGRFQEFLKARSEDRLGLLRALFGTERFARFEAEVTERAKALEQAVGTATTALLADVGRLAELAQLDAPDEDEAGWASGLAIRLAAAAEQADAAAQDARTAFAAADAAAAAAVTTADRQRRRADARAALVRLDAQREAVDAVRVRIAAAVRMLPLLPSVEAAERAGAALPRAEQTVAAAREDLGEDVSDPATAGAEAEGLLGALGDVLALERDLPRLRAAVPAAEAAQARAEDDLATRVADAAALPAQRSAQEAVRVRAEAALAGAPAADEALARCGRIVAAVSEEARTAQLAATADVAYQAALAQEEAAAARTRALVTARLAGAAGLLAAELRPGEPCPVCGAAEHPHPAQQDAETPDERTVAQAEERQRDAAERRAAASTAASAARAAHAEAAGAAGGATADEAAARLRDAEAAVAACRAAAAARAEAERALDALTAREATSTASLEAARARLQQRVGEVATARAALDAAAARVDAARDGHPSVADRVAGLRRRRAALLALETAMRRLEQARADRQDAVTRLDRVLADAGVPDAAAVRAAALPSAEREAEEQRVQAWESAREGASAQLRDPDLAAAPDEPADVDGTAAAKADALTARDAAADRLAAARGRAAQAEDLAARIGERDAAIAHERSELAVVGPLAEVVRGGGTNALRMRLESYVLAARLEQIVEAANARLGAMTDGRFVLQHDDAVAYRGARSGLGLEVLDEHTGRARPVASLSGGETFLASLALALGLAEVVSAEAGGVRLDTLFVDEGFGSLDRRTLDTAMETLDSLRAGGRMVGLISHVEAMQEDIPAGLHVERLPDGSSEVRPRLPAGV